MSAFGTRPVPRVTGSPSASIPENGRSSACGRAPTTFRASSFAETLVGLSAWLLRPRSASSVSVELFPPARSFHSRVPEAVLETVLSPLWAGLRRALLPLRALQQGRIQQYLIYVLLTLCLLLAWRFPADAFLERFLVW